jgi:hypothetical protein
MFRNRFTRFAGCCVLAIAAPWVHAQSIGVSPASPTSSDAITATFTQPFDCSAPQPSLVDQSGTSLTFESVLPNGIVNCPFIPVPPPQVSQFSAALGTLGAGMYTVTWKIYRAQPSGSPQLLSTASASFTVSAARGAGAAVAFTPALSAWALLLLVAGCALLALRSLLRRSC